MNKTQHNKEHNSCIVENSMLNGLQNNLKNAIEYAGAYVSKKDCLWEYPEIIKNKLVAKTINNINVLGNDVISISQDTEDNNIVYNISTIYNTTEIELPNYVNPSNDWEDSMSIDKVFKELFTNILPAVKGIHAGDMTATDSEGNDIKPWTNTLFNKSGNKSGLNVSSKYLRLYLTSQAEPLYILINGIVTDTTIGYNVKNSDTVDLIIDETNTLSAHISCITSEQIDTMN
jgi:hypothetical protein